MYRVKFILSDGRKVYPTDKGRIQVSEQPFMDDKTARSFLESGGYTQELTMFIMGDHRKAPLRIVEFNFEHVASPIDRTAFVLGGQLACMTFQT